MPQKSPKNRRLGADRAAQARATEADRRGPARTLVYQLQILVISRPVAKISDASETDRPCCWLWCTAMCAALRCAARCVLLPPFRRVSANQPHFVVLMQHVGHRHLILKWRICFGAFCGCDSCVANGFKRMIDQGIPVNGGQLPALPDGP